MFSVPGLHVDISKSELTLQLNGLFRSDSVHCMLEAKYYQGSGIDVSFLCAYGNKATAYNKDAKQPKWTRCFLNSGLNYIAES